MAIGIRVIKNKVWEFVKLKRIVGRLLMFTTTKKEECLEQIADEGTQGQLVENVRFFIVKRERWLSRMLFQENRS